MKRTFALTLLAAALFAVPGSALASAAFTPDLARAGVWHQTSYIRCMNSPANAHPCGLLLGPNWVVIGIRGTQLTVQESSDVIVSSTGDFLIEETTSAREKAPGATPIDCAVEPFEQRGYNGTCTWYSWYHGNKIVAKKDVLLFRASRYAIAFQRYVAPQFQSCTCGFEIPRPGSYSTAQFLALRGIHATPAALVGVTARLTVTYTR